MNEKIIESKKNLIQNRIDSLINEIKEINSMNEYLRIKYYDSMILKIELLKSYIKILNDIELDYLLEKE